MKIQIVSGFLGAGKTTFLNRYISCLSKQVAVIENEFGKTGLDAGLIAGNIPVKEMNAGCICCSMAMNFREGIQQLEKQYNLDYILIEPSGVGRLSDIVKACVDEGYQVDKLITMLDLSSYEAYAEAFGEFYLDQIACARLILPTNLEKVDPKSKEILLEKLHKQNPKACIYEGDWRDMDDEALLELVEMSSGYDLTPDQMVHHAPPADKIFSSVAVFEIGINGEEQLEARLKLLNQPLYGQVLRAKGMVRSDNGSWLHFDFTPQLCIIRPLPDDVVPQEKVIFIGCGLNPDALQTLFKEK